MQERFAIDAVERLAFESWARFGSVPHDILDMRRLPTVMAVEFKFNPYHDPVDGRFTFGPNTNHAAHEYRGMTAGGVRKIRPVSGGGTDRNGRPVPEMFAPDRYALHSPDEALMHFLSGSGEDRNYYFQKVDTSHVTLANFPSISKVVAEAKPGLHKIVDALGGYNGGTLGRTSNLTSPATVGGLTLRASGVLAIAGDGYYTFSGRLSADDDIYDFNKRRGRSPLADASTKIGRQISGKSFTVHMIGSKPFSERGRR